MVLGQAYTREDTGGGTRYQIDLVDLRKLDAGFGIGDLVEKFSLWSDLV